MNENSSASYRILQISDVHFGSTFDLSLWEYIRALIKRERPNLVVCTGDIVDHGGLFMLALARMQFDELPRDTETEHQFRCVPGNHDCGPWGNLKFRPFSTNFAAVFGRKPLKLPRFFPTYLQYRAMGWYWRLIFRAVATVTLYLFKWGTALWRKLSRGESLASIPMMRGDDPPEVVLMHLNSNHQTWLASGSVDVNEITRLKAMMLNVRDEVGGRAFAPRIALIHHHPLPIPDSKISRGLTSFEPFLVLRNAGILLRELNRCDVDLVLHGHKHYTSFSRLGYSLDHRTEGEIAVLGAGSAGVTHGEQGRNSVNFIDVFKSGRISYTTIFFGGGAGAPVRQLFESTRFVHDVDMHKMRLHRRAIERQGHWIERTEHTVSVDSAGVAVVTQDICGLRFERTFGTRSVPVYIEVSMGRVPHTTLALSEKSRSAGHSWIARPTAPQHRIECEIDLGMDLTVAGALVDLGYRYVSFNTYAITEWETLKARARDLRLEQGKGRAAGLEFTGVVVRSPMRELVLEVQLPISMIAPEPMVRVMRWHSHPDLPLDKWRHFREDADEQGWVYDSDATEHEGGRLIRIGENRWQFRVSHPMVGHRYEVKWRVRDVEIDRANQGLETARRGLAKAFREILLSPLTYPFHAAAARDWLSTLHEAVIQPDFGATLGRPDELEVAVFAYDDENQELRLSLAFPSTPVYPGKVPMSVPLGEGVLGAALKRSAVVFYIDPELSGSTDDAAYLYQDLPDAEWTSPKWKFVVAFPLLSFLDPLETRSENYLGALSPAGTVGVLTLSSTATDSGLWKLTESVAMHTNRARTDEPMGPHLPSAESTVPSSEVQADVQSDALWELIWTYAQWLLARLSEVSDEERKAAADSAQQVAIDSAKASVPESNGVTSSSDEQQRTLGVASQPPSESVPP